MQMLDFRTESLDFLLLPCITWLVVLTQPRITCRTYALYKKAFVCTNNLNGVIRITGVCLIA